MAATREVEHLPDERCPECGSGFAQDLINRGFRRHLERLPKRHPDGTVVVDAQGNPVICGGTEDSWNKGHQD